jgi:hypothetical protein
VDPLRLIHIILKTTSPETAPSLVLGNAYPDSKPARGSWRGAMVSDTG